MADLAPLAHVLRRMTFGPRPGAVEALGEIEPSALIDSLLAAPPRDVAFPELGTDDDEGQLLRWWLGTMADPDAGLHERMVWFWHGHLTSSLDKCEPALMLRQHRLLRTHALGNLRTLMREITVDAAMLQWLDGNGSQASAPNENYAREVMELFTLGRGSFTEADVRAGAYLFSGWTIDEDHGNRLGFDASAGPTTARDFLGTRAASAEEAIDAICDHPACAPFVAGKLYEHLVGQPPADDVRADLARQFVDSGLDIAVVVAAVVHHESFLAARDNRPRSPLEFFLASQAVLDTELDVDALEAMGQVPFRPPNVAGWPGSARWLTAGAVFAKAELAYDSSEDTATLDGTDPVADILAKAGLYDVGEDTRTALGAASAAVEGRRDRASLLHALALSLPEFSIA